MFRKHKTTRVDEFLEKIEHDLAKAEEAIEENYPDRFLRWLEVAEVRRRVLVILLDQE